MPGIAVSIMARVAPDLPSVAEGVRRSREQTVSIAASCLERL